MASGGGAPWWLSIVTAAMAGGFTLLGVRLTQRHAAEQRRLDRLEDRRIEQRTALVEVLLHGREFATSVEGLGMVAWKLDPVELTRLDSWVTYADRHQAHSRALVNARLVVRDAVVRDQVQRMVRAADELTPLVGRIQQAGERNGRTAPVDLLGDLRTGANGYRLALDELERLTRERVVDDPQEGQRRRWRRVFAAGPRRDALIRRPSRPPGPA